MAAPRLPLARRPDDARADSSSRWCVFAPKAVRRDHRPTRKTNPEGWQAARNECGSPLVCPAEAEMFDHQREIYHSENGDRWLLCRDDDGRVFVLHKANLASGGTATKIELGDFLGRGKAGPEHLALARLIGSLVD